MHRTTRSPHARWTVLAALALASSLLVAAGPSSGTSSHAPSVAHGPVACADLGVAVSLVDGDQVDIVVDPSDEDCPVSYRARFQGPEGALGDAALTFGSDLRLEDVDVPTGATHISVWSVFDPPGRARGNPLVGKVLVEQTVDLVYACADIIEGSLDVTGSGDYEASLTLAAPSCTTVQYGILVSHEKIDDDRTTVELTHQIPGNGTDNTVHLTDLDLDDGDWVTAFTVLGDTGLVLDQTSSIEVTSPADDTDGTGSTPRVGTFL